MSFRSSWLLLAALLIFAGPASAESGGETASKSGIALEKLKRSSQKKAGKNLFVAKAWGTTVRRSSQPKGTATRQVVTPVTPVAPPMPFSYMGKMFDEESGKLILYLAKGDIPYSVSVGEVIEGTYRVEAVTETVLTLIYLPLNTKQTLIIGESDS